MAYLNSRRGLKLNFICLLNFKNSLVISSLGCTGAEKFRIQSSTSDLMIGLKSSANNNQCFSIQSNRILGQFCSSPITANLVCCDWLKIRTYPKIISATINSRRPNSCVMLVTAPYVSHGP